MTDKNNKKNGWGGARQNAGRPASPATAKRSLTIRLSPQAMAIVETHDNKSQFIESLIQSMRYATITNKATGEQIRVHTTANHPDSSYGQLMWVDDDNNAYMQVGAPNPFYEVSED